MATANFIASCPSCGTANRIPKDKEGLHGRCGNCKSALPALYCHPKPLNYKTFDSFIASFPGPVLAEFWAPT